MHRLLLTIHLFVGAIVVTGLSLCSSQMVFAEEPEVGPGGSRVPVEVLDSGETEKDYYEQKQEAWSETIVSTASYMDSFFDNERYVTTSNRTYLRMRLSPIYDRHGLSFNTYFDLRLLLPNSEKWLLNFGGDPDEESRYGSSPLQDQEAKNSGDDGSNTYLGLSTFLKRTRTRNVSLGGGIKLSNGIIPYGTLKWVEVWEFKKWDLRAMQRLRYYTSTGPEFKSQLDADFPIAHKWYLRGSGSVLFKKEDPNSYYDLDGQLYQYLTSRKAIKYQVRGGYLSEPGRSTYLSTMNYEIQYKQQWRDWFTTNFTPYVEQQDARGWKLDPGFRIDFNVIVGHTDNYEFKSAYQLKRETLEVKAREDRDKALKEAHEHFMEKNKEKEEADRKAQEAEQN